jgi:hypothetical protein
MCKQWTRYNPRTNTWIFLQPLMVAKASYLVTSQDDAEGNVAFMSVFIRALIENFAPMQSRLRYLWHGEGQERKCTCSALLIGESEPHPYTTPPLRLITPKKSPLWASDPDRQLAYYASRAWARMYCSSVLEGVYDEDELDGERMPVGGSEPPKALAASERLHQRLQEAKAAGAERAGFRPGVVEAGIAGEVPVSYETGTSGQKAPANRKAKGAPGKGKARKGAGQRKGRTSEARARGKPPSEGQAQAGTAPEEAQSAETEQVPAAPQQEAAAEAKPAPRAGAAAPRNLGQYRAHVRRWLAEYHTEEDIEAHWSKERSLRNQCGVTEEDRVQIRAELLNQRVLEVRK